MSGRQIKKIRAALEAVRESETLCFKLRVSIGSISSANELIGAGLECYLKKTKTSLQFQLVFGYIKIVFSGLSKATLVALRATWLRMTKKSRVSN